MVVELVENLNLELDLLSQKMMVVPSLSQKQERQIDYLWGLELARGLLPRHHQQEVVPIQNRRRLHHDLWEEHSARLPDLVGLAFHLKK